MAWIKVELDLLQDMRVRRIARGLAERHGRNDQGLRLGDMPYEFWITLALGCLIQLWMYADTHASDDDILTISCDEVDELTGVEGFAKLLPKDWLEIIDPQTVKLPGFHEHNGTVSKQRALAAKRQLKWRKARGLKPFQRTTALRNGHDSVTPTLTGALTDYTRLDLTDRNSALDLDSGSDSFHLESPVERGPAKRRPTKRCPPDWLPDPAEVDKLAAECPGVNQVAELAKLHDHQFSSGRVDWPATYRNWIRNAYERLHPPAKPTRYEQLTRNLR